MILTGVFTNLPLLLYFQRVLQWCLLLGACLSPSLSGDAYAAGSLTQREHGVKVIHYPEIDYGEGEQKALLQKGEYLTKAGDCISCHTDTRNQGEPFAGGLAVDTPFGKVYSTNITADPETGIGHWTEQQFLTAMREGKSPDGKHYFPAFPYTSFTKVSEADLLAIKAYLFAVPKVKRDATENELRFPYRIRGLQAGWKLLFFDAGEFKPNPNVPQKINRGAYLVQGLTHCGECHTPRNRFGAMKKEHALTGAFIDGYYAPDITTYGLGDSPIEEVVKVFTEGRKLRGRGYVEGPMEAVDHNSLKHLSDYDLTAIAEYLKRVEAPMTNSVVDRIANEVTSAEAKQIYQSHCSVCHDMGVANSPKLSEQSAWQARLQDKGFAQLIYNATHGINAMPVKGTCNTCTDAEIEATVKYMLDISLAGEVTFDLRRPPASAKNKKLTLADGKKIYELNCAVCHAEGQVGSPKVGDKDAWKDRMKQNMDVLFSHAIHGYKGHPAKGACVTCDNQDIIAATKYMVSESTDEGDITLW